MRLPWKRQRPTVAPFDQITETSGTGAAPAAPDAAPAAAPTPPAPHKTPAQAMAQASAATNLRGPASSPALAPPVTSMPHAGAQRRRGIIPRWAPWVAGGTVAAIVLIVILVVVFSRADTVRVPSLAGLDRKAAEARLQELDLRLVVGDRRFAASTPVGTIIDQRPAPGTLVQAGGTVTVAISGGSETFAMPDVIGQTLDAARAKLRDRGLSVEFQTALSDKDEGTVVSSVPSPGLTIQTGDTVRLTVAAGTSGSDTLLPSNLKGKTFVLDPAPLPAGTTGDTTMDVARRVRALLEASGARVIVTRKVTDTGDATNTLARSRRAKETSSTALVGFSVTQSGATGLAVMSMPNTSTTQPLYIRSLSLAQAMSDALKTSFGNITTSPAGNDTILSDTGVPGLRLRLGSSQSSTDRLTFTDPLWADNVAKAVYRAIAQVFGGR